MPSISAVFQLDFNDFGNFGQFWAKNRVFGGAVPPAMTHSSRARRALATFKGCAAEISGDYSAQKAILHTKIIVSFRRSHHTKVDLLAEIGPEMYLNYTLLDRKMVNYSKTSLIRTSSGGSRLGVLSCSSTNVQG